MIDTANLRDSYTEDEQMQALIEGQLLPPTREEAEAVNRHIVARDARSLRINQAIARLKKHRSDSDIRKMIDELFPFPA